MLSLSLWAYKLRFSHSTGIVLRPAMTALVFTARLLLLPASSFEVPIVPSLSSLSFHLYVFFY